MSRATLSETLNRLLPGEQNKRIREGILASASYSGQRTDQLRRQIDRENRKQTGVLLVGELTFDSDTQVTLSGWIWVINFAIKQPEGNTVLTVQDKDPNFTRPDYFIGMPDGTIEYRASTFDQFGNSIPPAIAEDEVILRITYRNADGSNEQEDPVETPPGLDGWTPILAVVSDGERRVLQVVDWTGGTGTKPNTGLYVGPAGLVAAIGDAVDIRGAQGPAGSGGGGGGSAYITDLNTWPILKFDQNYRYIHEMTGPVTISAHMLAPLPVPGNFNKLYIKANGVNKPVFTQDFEVVWDNWANTAGSWNRVFTEYTPEGKVILQIEQAHLGTSNDGSGSNTITVKFDQNHVQQHIISASTQIVIDATDAQVGFETILYVKSDGVNKPFWNTANIVVTYDNYVNLANVWNRIKLEWRPENKAIMQLINI